MKQLVFYIIFISNISCSKKSVEKDKLILNKGSQVNNKNFKKTIDSIKSSDTYENPENWEARGLMPSPKLIIFKLRQATNDFLRKLDSIQLSNDSYDAKKSQIKDIVDELPWDELDTEEKEFLADTLTPAIKAAGFDPLAVF
ncbi:hypothetical protein [Chryseobacterium sp. Leaf394]|uniref:hypothetical protein n=1 Tax=Chryseobacterium sp. Leaf394 TaxID=1736361 RepID=UPI0006F92AE7|nr:hypothetical protein [Chryseobacterium sp. Leaf394]KQS90151.1 hypothetical protein ASG21_14405 [Chryseobacterium sp. Leaf394]